MFVYVSDDMAWAEHKIKTRKTSTMIFDKLKVTNTNHSPGEKEGKTDVKYLGKRTINFPVTPPVRQSVGRSVINSSLKGREVTLPCSFRSSC